jgi:hypothetical protein
MTDISSLPFRRLRFGDDERMTNRIGCVKSFDPQTCGCCCCRHGRSGSRQKSLLRPQQNFEFGVKDRVDCGEVQSGTVAVETDS